MQNANANATSAALYLHRYHPRGKKPPHKKNIPLHTIPHPSTVFYNIIAKNQNTQTKERKPRDDDVCGCHILLHSQPTIRRFGTERSTTCIRNALARNSLKYPGDSIGCIDSFQRSALGTWRSIVQATLRMWQDFQCRPPYSIKEPPSPP